MDEQMSERGGGLAHCTMTESGTKVKSVSRHYELKGLPGRTGNRPARWESAGGRPCHTVG